jgi:hypothetical protein
MDLLYSFLFGVSVKIYDDITDLKLIKNKLVTESIKSLNILFLTLAGQNDFIFSLYILITSLLTNGFDEEHWKSYFMVSLLLSIISFKIPESIILPILIFIVSTLLLLYEDKNQPEEVSKKKLITRIGVLLGCIIIYISPVLGILESIFGDIHYLSKIIMLFCGMMLVSILTQSYMLYFRP